MDRRDFLKASGWTLLGLAAAGTIPGCAKLGDKDSLPDKLKKGFPSLKDLKVFWGDLHNHCNVTYGHGDLSDALAAAGGVAQPVTKVSLQLSRGDVTASMPLDDIIIGTVNTTDPLLDPSGVCELACIRRLKGTTPEMIAQIRREILHCTAEELQKLSGLLRAYLADGHFCAVGNAEAVAFVKE